MGEHRGAAKGAEQGEGCCSVWRLDDNGNEFLVRGCLTEEEALRLVREYEARGHKQAYWISHRGEGRQTCSDQGEESFNP